MKSPPRPFVVEIKSGRRRSQMHPTSIWDGTNINAVLRKARDDAPHLFASADEQEALDHSDERQPDIEPCAGDDSADAGCNDARTDLNPDDVITAPIAPADELPTAIGQGLSARLMVATDADIGKKPARKTSRRLGKADGKTHRESAQVKHDPVIAAPGVSASMDELERLEAENRQLKAALSAQLHQQNRWLREKLAYF